MAVSSTSFKPGNPGGPGRKPLEQSLTKALRDTVNPADAVRGLLALTQSKDEAIRMRAWGYIYDRLDGTPLQSLRTSSDELPRIVVRPRGDTPSTGPMTGGVGGGSITTESAPVESMSDIPDSENAEASMPDEVPPAFMNLGGLPPPTLSKIEVGVVHKVAAISGEGEKA